MQSSVFLQSKTEPVSLCWSSEKKKKFIDTKKSLAAILIQITSCSKIRLKLVAFKYIEVTLRLSAS